MGDLDRGSRAIDISGKDERLYSLTCPLMLAMILVAIPKYTKGKLALVPPDKQGQPLKSKVEALDDPKDGTPRTSCLRQAQLIKQVLLSERGKASKGKSRNGRRSWIIFAVFRSSTRANFPSFRSMSEPQRCERSKRADVCDWH